MRPHDHLSSEKGMARRQSATNPRIPRVDFLPPRQVSRGSKRKTRFSLKLKNCPPGTHAASISDDIWGRVYRPSSAYGLPNERNIDWDWEIILAHVHVAIYVHIHVYAFVCACACVCTFVRVHACICVWKNYLLRKLQCISILYLTISPWWSRLALLPAKVWGGHWKASSPESGAAAWSGNMNRISIKSLS